MAEPGAWEPIRDYERYWRSFDDRYSFAPKYTPVDRPGITEPAESVTYSLAPLFEVSVTSTFAVTECMINAAILRAFCSIVAPDECLVALDWQHQGYWFWPHRQPDVGERWPITPVPEGDYFIFVTEDMATGTFGHPWEPSLCVFGGHLVNVLSPTLSEWLPTLRKGANPEADGSNRR